MGMSDYETMLHRYEGFVGSQPPGNHPGVVILGAPMDWTVSYKPGCRFGPQAIRHASYGLEEFSPWQERELSDCQYADGGNIWLPVGNVEESLEAIYQRVAMITKQRNIPFLLGGEHLISLPAVRAVAEQYPELVVLHLDAHADLRDRLFGQQLSHGTVLRQIGRASWRETV